MYFKDLKPLLLFENSDFVVVNKPAGISTLDDRAEAINMLALVRKNFAAAQACHRIDKETSGVLVFAKNQTAYRHLSMQFQKREVKKVYHAVVNGAAHFDNLKVEVPLLVKEQGIVKWDTKLGKASETVFNTLQNFTSWSLVECCPRSGRRHQIRVHLKYADHSIVADSMYGGQDIYLSQIKKKYKHKESVEKPIIARVALHAQSITFNGTDEKQICVNAAYPKDFRILIKQLEKYASK